MDEYINAAVEQFRELLCQQAARQARMEKKAPAKDFARAEKTVIGVIGGDGIGPIIMAQALRVLGAAYRDVETLPGRLEPSTVERELTFLGLFGMMDPPRPEAARAVARCRRAGIRPVMITGDHRATALAIARQLDICREGELAVTGSELDFMSQELLEQVQADAQGYSAVVQAYAVEKQNPERPQIIEQAVTDACTAPQRIMVLCCDALDCIAVYAAIGSRMMASDTGSAAVCCRAALQAAALTVFTNTAHLKNQAVAEEINRRVYRMLKSYCVLADRIFDEIRESFGQ